MTEQDTMKLSFDFLSRYVANKFIKNLTATYKNKSYYKIVYLNSFEVIRIDLRGNLWFLIRLKALKNTEKYLLTYKGKITENGDILIDEVHEVHEREELFNE